MARIRGYGQANVQHGPPYDADDVFVWGPDTVDPMGVLPPLDDTINGPEIGFDGEEGYEIAWTKLNTSDDTWFHARAAANLCIVPLAGSHCFDVQNFQNDDDPYDYRWSPFVTQNSELTVPPPAKVSYLVSVGAPSVTGKRKAFRELEDPISTEIVIDGGTDSSYVGRWVRMDNKDYLMSTLGPHTGTDPVHIVLYDPDDPATPIIPTANEPGRYNLGVMEKDPATDLYTLVTVRTETDHSFMDVFQKIGPDWVLLYEFDAEDADPELDSDSYFVTSPELFHFEGHLYIAFLASNSLDFGGDSAGNIMITRVEDPDLPSDNHYRILNRCDDGPVGLNDCTDTTVPSRKRTEPEVHYLANGRPVVYYSLREDEEGDLDCPPIDPEDPPVTKLMRTSPGDLWEDEE